MQRELPYLTLAIRGHVQHPLDRYDRQDRASGKILLCEHAGAEAELPPALEDGSDCVRPIAGKTLSATAARSFRSQRLPVYQSVVPA